MKTRRPLLTTPPQLQRRDAVRLQREVPAAQPWVGLGGLVLSAAVFFALALGLGNTATSLLVLGPMTVFAVSGVAMIGFWWNDWPGSRLNKPWTGLTDAALIVVGGVVLTIAGEAIIERPDIRGIPGHSRQRRAHDVSRDACAGRRYLHHDAPALTGVRALAA